jgi:hypothetical protein
MVNERYTQDQVLEIANAYAGMVMAGALNRDRENSYDLRGYSPGCIDLQLEALKSFNKIPEKLRKHLCSRKIEEFVEDCLTGEAIQEGRILSREARNNVR